MPYIPLNICSNVLTYTLGFLWMDQKKNLLIRIKHSKGFKSVSLIEILKLKA